MKALPWSHTALTGFNTCPKQYAEIKVYKRVVEEQGTDAEWGNYVHAQIEKFLTTRKAVPENVQPYMAQVMQALDWTGGDRTHPGSPGSRGRMIMAEHKMALNGRLQRTDWFAKDVWSRAIADLLVIDETVAWVADWKTGKVKPDSRQLKLFALFVFYHFPWVNTCHTSFEWIKFNEFTRETFTRSQMAELWQPFIPELGRLKEAFATETWQAKPSGLCNGWCPVTDCQHWKPKR